MVSHPSIERIEGWGTRRADRVHRFPGLKCETWATQSFRVSQIWATRQSEYG